MRIDFASPHEPVPKQDRSHELVNDDRRGQQQLNLTAPAWKLGRHHGRKSQRNSGLRHESRPHIRCSGGRETEERDPRVDTQLDEPEADERQGECRDTDCGQRVKAHRRSDRHEEHDEHGRRAESNGGAKGVALRNGQILDHQACGNRSH